MAGTNENDLFFWGARPTDQSRRPQSESGDRTDTESGNNKRHRRNPSGSMSIGSADSVELSPG